MQGDNCIILNSVWDRTLGGFYNQNAAKNDALIKAIITSYKWNKEILYENKSIKDIWVREKLTKRYVTRMINLSFLSSKIVTVIMQGKQPSDLTVRKLLAIKTTDWKEQEKIIFA